MHDLSLSIWSFAAPKPIRKSSKALQRGAPAALSNMAFS